MNHEPKGSKHERPIEPEVLPPIGHDTGAGGAGADASEAERPPGPVARIFWTVAAMLCGIYIFIPEFSDAFPVIGWLDEATAAAIVLVALRRLGIRIPYLQPVIDWFVGRRGKK